MKLGLERIQTFCGAFREAILRTGRADLPSSFRNFPLGCCGDTCLLLAKFLINHGAGFPDYVVGTSGRQSHAWLEIGSVIVDITADQFLENPVGSVRAPSSIRAGVIVTTTRAWHKQFREQNRHPADIDSYDAATKKTLLHAYAAIMLNLPSSLALRKTAAAG
jgi:hypothetical protein